jgi:Fic family protein
VNPQDFSTAKHGRLLKGTGGYWAFIPAPIPQSVQYTSEIVQNLTAAVMKVGVLEGLCHRLPNPHLLSGAYVSREAVLSSRIEGTQSTQSDLYLYEMDPDEETFPADIREVQNYVLALEYALVRRTELPLSLRLIREIHERLLTGVRGSNQTPGEFRKSQNWIGGRSPSDARYVPPPSPEMLECLHDFEKFLQRPDSTHLPPLIECALVHYQFEAIHPFLDGNGRVGRLLILLLAIERQCISQPILYLSAFFEKNRDRYYDLLYQVSTAGAWEEWINFFLKGVAEQADDALWRANKVLDLQHKYNSLYTKPTARRLIDLLFVNPYITIKYATRQLEISAATASNTISQLVESGVLQPQLESRKRGQRYIATELYDAFVKEMPPQE